MESRHLYDAAVMNRVNPLLDRALGLRRVGEWSSRRYLPPLPPKDRTEQLIRLRVRLLVDLAKNR